MDGQAITTKSDLERILLDGSMEAKALPLSLLKCITNNFSDEHEIGRGGFAVVYKGRLDYREVAVKKLFQNCIGVDEKKFIGEVHCMMKAKHKNIVRCLGYCSDTQGQMVEYNGKLIMVDACQRLLCFEYVPNGNVKEYIKDASREWEKCYKIIKGVCEGLHYLHEERIVHRDLTPANILLDNDMVPKITDFGISRCFDELQTHDFTSKLVGTLGYLAPELIHDGKITLKSDIYNLGTIITEILTGDKGRPKVEEVKNHWSHKLEGSQKELQLEQIRVCTEVAQTCLECNPEDRPSAQEIIDTLKQTERVERCIEPGASSHNPRSLGVQVHTTPLTSTAAAKDRWTRLQEITIPRLSLVVASTITIVIIIMSHLLNRDGNLTREPETRRVPDPMGVGLGCVFAYFESRRAEQAARASRLGSLKRRLFDDVPNDGHLPAPKDNHDDDDDDQYEEEVEEWVDYDDDDDFGTGSAWASWIEILVPGVNKMLTELSTGTKDHWIRIMCRFFASKMGVEDWCSAE